MRFGTRLTTGHILGDLNMTLLRVARLETLLAVVINSTLDGIFGQHRAVELHWRQRKLTRDLCVADSSSFIQRHALHTLGHVTRTRNGRAAAKRLEAHIFDDTVLVHLNTKLHNITARRGTDKTNTNVRIGLQKRAHLVC